MNNYVHKFCTTYGIKESWSEVYTNMDKMKRRLSNIVKNNGKNTMKQIEEIVKWNWVVPRKNWDTLSLNPVYKPQIKKYMDEYLIKEFLS